MFNIYIGLLHRGSGEEESPNLTESLEHFPFLVLSRVRDDKGLCVCMYVRLYKPEIKQLGLLLQLLKPPRQIVKVDVIRGGGVSADGGCGECVRNRGEFWESVVVKYLRRRARTYRVIYGIKFNLGSSTVYLAAYTTATK